MGRGKPMYWWGCNGCGIEEIGADDMIPKDWYHMADVVLCPKCYQKMRPIVEDLSESYARVRAALNELRAFDGVCGFSTDHMLDRMMQLLLRDREGIALHANISYGGGAPFGLRHSGAGLEPNVSYMELVERAETAQNKKEG